jgi:hypothetical protein
MADSVSKAREATQVDMAAQDDQRLHSEQLANENQASVDAQQKDESDAILDNVEVGYIDKKVKKHRKSTGKSTSKEKAEKCRKKIVKTRRETDAKGRQGDFDLPDLVICSSQPKQFKYSSTTLHTSQLLMGKRSRLPSTLQLKRTFRKRQLVQLDRPKFRPRKRLLA